MNNENPLVFCRLCGKFKPADEIMAIQLAKMGNLAIKYNGCKACSTVIHNATLIVKETSERFMKERAAAMGMKQ
jgi:Pyruvate/2-oxoacid:ferredoxin oxidoreductase delta subunit